MFVKLIYHINTLYLLYIIYAYTPCRDWFAHIIAPEELLRRELNEERIARQAAEESYRNTLRLLQQVERDRDSHRVRMFIEIMIGYIYN